MNIEFVTYSGKDIFLVSWVVLFCGIGVWLIFKRKSVVKFFKMFEESNHVFFKILKIIGVIGLAYGIAKNIGVLSKL